MIEHSSAGNHNGGQLHFGPDRCLWITTGDGGGQDNQFDNAQNLAPHKGKILRINPDPPSRSGPACGSPPVPQSVGPPPPVAPADTFAPRLRTRIKRRQRVLRLRGPVAYARCDEPWPSPPAGRSGSAGEGSGCFGRAGRRRSREARASRCG